MKKDNWFADRENFCYEYSHGLISTGLFTAGVKAPVKTGVLRYCITCHIRDGKVNRVHEYINSTAFWLALFLQLMLTRLHRRATRKFEPPRGFRGWNVSAVPVG